MTSKEFVYWIKGYIKSNESISNNIPMKDIKEMLNELKDEEPIRYIIDTSLIPSKEKVPYHTICSCNPANRGTGTSETLNQNFTSK